MTLGTPKSPLAEATLRNDQEPVELLVEWKADVNKAARGDEYPLVRAIKQQRTNMVQCLLELRADPTVKTFPQTRHRAATPAWVGHTVRQLTVPGTAVARLIEEAEET